MISHFFTRPFFSALVKSRVSATEYSENFGCLSDFIFI